MAQASSEGWVVVWSCLVVKRLGGGGVRPSGQPFPTCGLSVFIWDMGIPPGGEGTIVRLKSLLWEGRRSEGEKSLSG